MSRTPFDREHFDRSYQAHLLARRSFYPSFFSVSPSALVFTTATTGLDFHHAIDRIVTVQVHGYRSPVVHTIQERFRGERYLHFSDVTLTEWNTASNLPSELYKITAGWMVYGWHNDAISRFLKIVAFPVAPFLRALPHLPSTTHENSKGQIFRAFRLEDLDREGLLTR